MDATAQLPEVLRVPHIAKILGCSTGFVPKLSDSGRIPPSRRLGKLRVWSRDVFLKWVQDGMVPPREQAAVPA